MTAATTADTKRDLQKRTPVICPHCGATMPEWLPLPDTEGEYAEEGKNCRYYYLDGCFNQLLWLPLIAIILFMAAYIALRQMDIANRTLIIGAAVIIAIVIMIATLYCFKSLMSYRRWRRYIRRHGTKYPGRIRYPITIGKGTNTEKSTGLYPAKRFPVSYYSTIQERVVEFQSRNIAWRNPCPKEMTCDVYEIPDTERPTWANLDPWKNKGVVNWFGDIVIENIRVR